MQIYRAAGRWGGGAAGRVVQRRFNSANPYATLGLDKGASQDDIKKAYRRLAKKWHPDLNQGDREAAEKKFKQIAEAYQLISDPQRRQQYDAFGGGMPGGMPGGFPQGMHGMQGMQNMDPQDLFNQIFGQQKGSSVMAELEKVIKKQQQGQTMDDPKNPPHYNLNLADILSKAGVGGAAGFAGFAGGMPGGGCGGGGGGGGCGSGSCGSKPGGMPGGMPQGGAGFPGGFPGMGGMGGMGGMSGPGMGGGAATSTQTSTTQEVIVQPNGKRILRTTTTKNGQKTINDTPL